ncbi:glycosyltransferase [Clostridium sp.]|uniref:glycosyltransferase family 32 protein n=1 Tax=Clostridium sp. TaxID=1506 RepID=UPI00283ECDF8|nr:glycosyltransferase [Clostridium sp.]MDR3598466.1 glycosyltransferase [Clostridium sp.]
MNTIPKVIHYCWFGGKDKPQLIGECINSWKENLPDYKIIEWNEKNFNIEEFDFSKKAYNAKKWAFVADYCRIWVLYNYGGIYLDTDMEVLKSLDEFIKNESFAGIERDQIINAAILGAKAKNEFIKKIINYYDDIDFMDYIDDLEKIAIPNIITELAAHEGYMGNKKIENVRNIITIYSKEYFYPKNHSWERADITKNTYTIHHYEGSWRSKTKIGKSKFKQILINIFGYERIIKLTEKFNK